MQLKTVYVTVGTTKFDGLIETMKSPSVLDALQSRGCQKLILQHGNSAALHSEEMKRIQESHGIQIEQYKFRPNIGDIKAADLVIGHAGAGTCMDILNNKKPGLIVVNDELMDNHQLELAKQLATENYLYYCRVSQLEKELTKLDFSKLKPYEPAIANMQKFVNSLNELIKAK
ncbi:UDP-N-acetylglucosamine transferase subunit ALG13 [Drosophila tropicalis]|uniref:UDP-N-acetylglucosamine transferase subunit ALG13 n=1 Tax=Drosophila tropicalis TaxID=46794 RepID=UPI0035ABDC27